MVFGSNLYVGGFAAEDLGAFLMAIPTSSKLLSSSSSLSARSPTSDSEVIRCPLATLCDIDATFSSTTCLIVVAGGVEDTAVLAITTGVETYLYLPSSLIEERKECEDAEGAE
ncbi:hypothetical protein EON65_26075 [archaeon]|nr:MAG: hypothetical protein EON65_26075 [archaeon]